MFVGHYGVSFVAKRIEGTLPLWLLFLAVQLLDILWGILILLGIEKARIVPNITASLPVDLYYMPYTHSLVAALAWTGLVFLAYLAFRSQPSSGRRAAGVLGLAVLSHWPLDLLVHRPDLPLYDDSLKVGLGLWNYPLPALAIETACFVFGLALYLKATVGTGRLGKYGMLVFGVLMLAVHVAALFGPPPVGPRAAALTFLALYFLFAGGAFWLGTTRAKRTS